MLKLANKEYGLIIHDAPIFLLNSKHVTYVVKRTDGCLDEAKDKGRRMTFEAASNPSFQKSLENLIFLRRNVLCHIMITTALLLELFE